MRVRALILTLLVVGALVPPVGGHAQIIRTPDCEKTVYVAQPVGERGAPRQFTPDAWDALSEADKRLWNISEVTSTGACGFDDFLSLFANIAAWGFTVLAVTALFFFVWGGFTLLISAGREEKVQEGKRILSGTFIGVLVVLTAWVLVNFFYVTFAGNRYGYIFPGSQFERPSLGGGTECRSEFRTRFPAIQPSCSSTNLRYGCADPVASDGPVVRLQSLLAQKCGGIRVDGCFGDETAFALFAFRIANGLSVPSGDDFRDTAATAEVIDLLEDPGARSCAALVVDYAAPSTPSPDSTTGCCVPREGLYPCYDQSVDSFCIPDDPNGDPSLQPGYRWFAGACDTITQCTTGCCLQAETQTTYRCQEGCSETQCNSTAGTLWVTGPCPFSTGRCTPASVCGP